MALLLLAGCGVLQPQPDRTGQIRARWGLSGVDGERLELSVMTAADCERFAGVDVLETEESVEVRAWVEPSNDGCYPSLGYRAVTVDLGAPLGARMLNGCLIERSGLEDTRETCADLMEN